MTNPPPGIHDEFTEQGLFWLPENPDDQVAGAVEYGPEGGATLRLIDMFGGLSGFGRAPEDEPDVIHGVTTKGKPMSLLDAIRTKRQINMPGIPNETWNSSLLVIGAHIRSVEDERIFAKSYFRFVDIESWLEHSPFTDTFDPEAKTLNILAEKPRETFFASHADFEVSSVGSLYSNNQPTTRFVIDVTTQMAITPHEPQSLNWHLHRAVRLQELASLCTGHYLPLTSFELRGPDVAIGDAATMPAEVHFYARMRHGEAPEERHRHRVPMITGPEMSRFSENAVRLWFDQIDAFDPALRLFFTITGERRMFTNIRLLLAIQAL